MQFSRITFFFFSSRSDDALDQRGCLFRIGLCRTKYNWVAKPLFNSKVKSYECCWMKSMERMPAGCLWCKLHFASWGLYVPTSIAVFESSVTFLHLMEKRLIIFLQYSLYWPQTCVLFLFLTHNSSWLPFFVPEVPLTSCSFCST